MVEPFLKFPRSLQIFVLTEVSLYIAVATWALPHSHAVVVIGLIIIFAAAGLVLPVPHPFGGISDPNIGVIIVSALLWEPQDVLFGVGIGSFIGLILFRKNELWRAAMNGAGWGLPAAIATTVASGVVASMPVRILTLGLAAILAVATYRLVNTAIFAVYRSIRFGRSVLPDWRQSIIFQWPSQFLSAPLAVVLAGIAGRIGTTWSGLGLTAAYALALPVARQEYAYYNRAQQMLDETVEAVVRALEGTDPAARAHGDRVSKLAVETGRRFGMSERGLLALRLASRLHDVGHLAGPETEVHEGLHAAAGSRILAQFSDGMIAEFVQAHRERWDGKGVNNQRKGTEIPLGGRILAAAETYDSVRSGLSPFEVPRPQKDAVAYLRSLAGNVLDPKVVGTLLRVAAEHDKGDQAGTIES
jgi:HD domain